MGRLPPSFFIIGERKCATSSLYRYLVEHPQVLPCRLKEPQFFSKPWWYRWLFASRYRALFPQATDTQMELDWMDLNAEGKIIREKRVFHRNPALNVITGEASANIFAQVPPGRLKQAFPDAKLILCLRHPVDRAYSHYQMLKRFATEGRRIPFRLTDFSADFEADIDHVRNGGDGYFAGLSYYSGRLRKWTEVFGKDRICIVRAEDLSDVHVAQQVLSHLCAFLDIQDFDFSPILSVMVNKNPSDESLDADLGRMLWKYYAADVEKLEQYTGRSFNWNP